MRVEVMSPRNRGKTVSVTPWAELQKLPSQQLNCCGFTNYTDFVGSQFEEQSGGNLPPSCCQLNSAPCSPEEAQRSAVEGCFQQLLETLKHNANIVGGIAAGIGALEVAAMIVSMYLYCHLNNS
ncbi:tetraspanin-1-like [Diretmus argenteus]